MVSISRRLICRMIGYLAYSWSVPRIVIGIRFRSDQLESEEIHMILDIYFQFWCVELVYNRKRIYFWSVPAPFQQNLCFYKILQISKDSFAGQYRCLPWRKQVFSTTKQTTTRILSNKLTLKVPFFGQYRRPLKSNCAFRRNCSLEVLYYEKRWLSIAIYTVQRSFQHFPAVQEVVTPFHHRFPAHTKTNANLRNLDIVPITIKPNLKSIYFT